MSCNHPTIIMTITGPGIFGSFSQADGPVELCPTGYFKGSNRSDSVSTRERWDWNDGAAFINLYAGYTTRQSWAALRSDNSGYHRAISLSPTYHGELQDRLFTTYDLGNGTTVTLQRGPAEQPSPSPTPVVCPVVNVKERWYIYNENGELQAGTHNNQSNAVERLFNEAIQNGNEGWTAKAEVSLELD